MGNRAEKLVEFGLVAVILVLLNIVAQRVFYRCDLTESRRYTLSQASVNALEKLDDTLTVKAYFSKDIPASQAHLVNGVHDTLAEYKAHGGAKVQVEFIDPKDDPETLQEMRLLGIPEVTMTVFGRDQLEQKKVYMGVGLFYEDRKEVIQKVDRLEEFEYGLTSAVLKLSMDKPLGVGIWLGNPLPNAKEFWEDYQRYRLTEELDPLYRELKRQYNVQEVNFAGGAPVPEGIDTLLVVGPKRASERDLYEIDQFIMRGGRAIFLLDEEQHDEQMQATAVPSGLEPLLEHYGVAVGSNVVADRECAPALFRTRFFQSVAPYPFWPKVGGERIDRGNPALSSVQTVVLPWSAAIEQVPSKLGERTFTPLLQTSGYAKAHPLPAQLFGEQVGLLPAVEGPPLVLAALVEGPFESYFAGRPAPAPSAPPGSMAPPVPSHIKIPRFEERVDSARIVVVGSAVFATTQPLVLFQQLRVGAQNLLFVQNLVDWFTLGEGLIGIRARVAPVYPLEQTSETARGGIKALNLVAVPLLVVLFGIGRFLLRRRDRLVYEENYRLAHGMPQLGGRKS